MASIHPVTPWLQLRPLLELLAIAGLCGWTACLALGFSLFSPSKAILIGILGVAIGSSLWVLAGLPIGPGLSDVPLIPSLAGTLFVAFVVELVTEARQAAQELKLLESRKALPRSWEMEPGASPAPVSGAPPPPDRERSAAGPRSGG